MHPVSDAKTCQSRKLTLPYPFVYVVGLCILMQNHDACGASLQLAVKMEHEKNMITTTLRGCVPQVLAVECNNMGYCSFAVYFVCLKMECYLAGSFHQLFKD